MDCTPHPHFLRSIVNQGMPWWKALAELIDNSLDAGANQVVIKTSKQAIEVRDDGRGMKDVGAAVTLGLHNASGTVQQLGQYGVGLKDAWLFAGDEICVETVRDKVKTKLTVNINDFARSWHIDDPIPEATDSQSGTNIKLTLRSKRNPPGKDAWSTLQWVFTPALLHGKQIKVVGTSGKAELLSAVQLPPFAEVVCEQFDIEGRKVEVTIGIIQDGHNATFDQFWLQYGHRNIRQTDIGSKGFNLSRVCGVIKLGDGWKLTKNKDDLSEFCEELEDQIFLRIQFMLQRAEQMSEDVEATALKHELEGMLNDAIGDAKKEARGQKRNPGSGTVEPTGRKGKRKKAEKIHEDQPGSVEDAPSGGARKRGYKLAFGYHDNERLGRFDSLSNTITLNLSHPFVESIKRAVNKMALHAVSVAVLSDGLCNSDGKYDKTLFEIEDFGLTFGKLIKSVRRDDVNKAAI